MLRENQRLPKNGKLTVFVFIESWFSIPKLHHKLKITKSRFIHFNNRSKPYIVYSKENVIHPWCIINTIQFNYMIRFIFYDLKWFYCFRVKRMNSFTVYLSIVLVLQFNDRWIKLTKLFIWILRDSGVFQNAFGIFLLTKSPSIFSLYKPQRDFIAWFLFWCEILHVENHNL